MRSLLFFAGCFVLVALVRSAPADSSDYQLIDENGYDVANMATFICTTTSLMNKRIGKPSSMLEVIKHLQSLPERHALYNCGKENSESLRLLKEIIELGSRDTCNQEQAELMEQFYYRFVARSGFAFKLRPYSSINEPLAPIIIRMFYKSYAMDMANVCKKSFLDNIRAAMKANGGELDRPSNLVTKLVRRLSDIMITSSGNMFHGDYTMLVNIWDVYWGFSESRSLLETVNIDEIDQTTGSRVVLYASIKDSSLWRELQDDCLLKYRPLYSKTILPLARLYDIGFGHDFSSIDDELDAIEDVLKLGGTMQYCELALRVKIFEDPNVREDRIRITRKDESLQLTPGSGPDSSRKADDFKPKSAMIPFDRKMESVGSTFGTDIKDFVAEKIRVKLRAAFEKEIEMRG